ncbi:hypothetical protein P775_00630 [Puniceibacterium antarcticum]|uniref:GGDEF domain-containing protein n=1 Tax=Puniceibacterium antarcticum TaxID=1206336 RepID=A0A2G8RKS2_9RHOB|nr:GGDEF domain-containing protein [Puniceibacterium antarcticum]PIL22184.1 hypothetical protein P775_00630 [Puniceibacterium antarcticum]
MQPCTTVAFEEPENAILKGICISIWKASEPIFLVDDLGSILFANEAADALTCPHLPETLGALGSTEEVDPDVVLQRATGQSGGCDLRFTLRSGESFVFSIRGLEFQRSNGRKLALVQMDAAKTMVSNLIAVQAAAETARDRLRQSLAAQVVLRREAQRLRHLAKTDHLTGLLNAAAFAQEVEATLDGADGQAGTLLYLDLNGFKAINDRFGHAVGDAVLARIAQRLRTELRQDDLIARLGGDEFGVWLGGLPLEDCNSVMSRLTEALSQPVQLSQPEAPMLIDTVSAALGYARWPEDGADATALLRMADSRMYAAKHKVGRPERITGIGPAENAVAAVSRATSLRSWIGRALAALCLSRRGRSARSELGGHSREVVPNGAEVDQGG